MNRRIIRSARRLRADAAGAALVEFAIILPVLVMMLLGLIEFGLNVYMRSVLEGAMIQAGRNSSLQSAQSGQTSIDDLVSATVHNILPSATVSFTRQNYGTFTSVDKPEDFTDSNGNGVRDPGECFQDANGNSVWDADGGRTGLGGAIDVVQYTATVTYPSFIPGGAAIGISPTTTIKATTMLRNQPFATQPSWTTTQVCT
jgi:Flp pilus assembly protein TadG